MLECYFDLLNWYFKEEDLESALSLVQGDAVQLYEFVQNVVENPFTYDIYLSQDVAKHKLKTVFSLILRINTLMSMLENEFDRNRMDLEAVESSLSGIAVRPQSIVPSPPDTSKAKRETGQSIGPIKGPHPDSGQIRMLRKKKSLKMIMSAPVMKKEAESGNFEEKDLSKHFNKMKYFFFDN